MLVEPSRWVEVVALTFSNSNPATSRSSGSTSPRAQRPRSLHRLVAGKTSASSCYPAEPWCQHGRTFLRPFSRDPSFGTRHCDRLIKWRHIWVGSKPTGSIWFRLEPYFWGSCIPAEVASAEEELLGSPGCTTRLMWGVVRSQAVTSMNIQQVPKTLKSVPIQLRRMAHGQCQLNFTW